MARRFSAPLVLGLAVIAVAQPAQAQLFGFPNTKERKAETAQPERGGAGPRQNGRKDVAESRPVPPGLVGGGGGGAGAAGGGNPGAGNNPGAGAGAGGNNPGAGNRPKQNPGGNPPPRQAAPVNDAASQRAIVDRLNAYLTSTHTLVGNFTQIGPDGGRTDGKFYLQKPGKIRFEYNPPSPIELIADGQSVAIRDRKLATQDLYLLSQTPLRYLLSDRINLQRDTNLVGISTDDTYITATIEEKQALAGNYKVVLMFGAQDYQLKQWTVTDAQGFDTTVALYNLDTTKKPDPNLFKIQYERMLQ